MSFSAHPGEHDRRRANVLVVEDDQALRVTVAEILRVEGYLVIQAADGLRALDLLRGGDIDVVLLDLRLPKLDGTAVLEALDEPPTVVILSGFESFEEVEIRRRFGPLLFECLRKPVSPRRLIAVTSAASDRATSRQTRSDHPPSPDDGGRL
jgi:DNA-binding response OmpR family regulator